MLKWKQFDGQDFSFQRGETAARYRYRARILTKLRRKRRSSRNMAITHLKRLRNCKIVSTCSFAPRRRPAREKRFALFLDREIRQTRGIRILRRRFASSPLSRLNCKSPLTVITPLRLALLAGSQNCCVQTIPFQHERLYASGLAIMMTAISMARAASILA